MSDEDAAPANQYQFNIYHFFSISCADDNDNDDDKFELLLLGLLSSCSIVAKEGEEDESRDCPSSILLIII